MKFLKIVILAMALLNGLNTIAQPITAPNNDHHGAVPLSFNLVHTKLDIRFDIPKRTLIGKEWLTLKPHFYTTDTLILDAKGLAIKTLGIIRNGLTYPVHYTYDNLYLHIKLDRPYTKDEMLTLFISYHALPDAVLAKGEHALNFINPEGQKNGKPTQIWNNGEPENNSSWFPTIDKPDQKTTQDLSLTVPAKYTTLSNGVLRSKKKKRDGTRTDRWVMDKPHAPYLFMLAIGTFGVVKD